MERVWDEEILYTLLPSFLDAFLKERKFVRVYRAFETFRTRRVSPVFIFNAKSHGALERNRLWRLYAVPPAFFIKVGAEIECQILYELIPVHILCLRVFRKNKSDKRVFELDKRLRQALFLLIEIHDLPLNA